jgi:hypothetical protein
MARRELWVLGRSSGDWKIARYMMQEVQPGRRAADKGSVRGALASRADLTAA